MTGTTTAVDRFSTPGPRELADTLRVLVMDAVQKAGSGHPGMPPVRAYQMVEYTLPHGLRDRP